MPRIKWKCPPKLVLDPSWHVASGEESFEIDNQKDRESTVIEAVYPHLSTIPPSPLISPDMEGKHDDDSQIPLIPLVPIEEAGEIEMSSDASAPGKTFNCHSASESLTHSRFNSSVSSNPPTGEKSLLDILRGLEVSDLAVAAGAAATVAAAMKSKHEIDTELLIKFLADPEMMKRLINVTGIGANSGLTRMHPLPSNSTSDPGIKISLPVSMNQPIPIKESTSDLGMTPAKRARICSPNLVPNWSPAPPRSNSQPLLIQELNNEARVSAISRPRTHGTAGTNKPRPLASPSYNENHHARLTDPEMVKTLVNETVIGANSGSRFPSGPKTSTHPLSSNSTSDPGIDIFVPVAVNQPIPIKESATDIGASPAKCARICSPNIVKNGSSAPPRSNSHPPLIQDLMNKAREPAIARPRTHGATGTNKPITLTSSTTRSYIENHHARLTDPGMAKTLVNETVIGADCGSRFLSGPKSTKYPLSSNSPPDPGIDVFVPVAMNQPIPIKESASDLGVTPAKRARICSPNLVKNGSPAPPRSNSHPPLIQDLMNKAREPAIARPRTHGATGTNKPITLTSSTTRSYIENHHARLTDPGMGKTLVNETVIGADCGSRFLSGPKSTKYPLSSNSPPDPGIDVFVPVAMNQPIPIKESASDLGVTPANGVRICSPNLVKNCNPAQPRSNSHPPLIRDLTNEAREPAFALSRTHGTTGTNEPRPLTAPTSSNNENQYARPINQYRVPNAAPIRPLHPSISKLNVEAASKPMAVQHPPPFFTGTPVSFPPPFSSTWRPFMLCMTDGCRALDPARCLGSNTSLPFAMGLNCNSTGTFHSYPFPSMNKLPSPVDDINYSHSLIMQHGEKNIRNEANLPKYGPPYNHLRELELAQNTIPLQIDPTVQKPCKFFSSSNGCRKGSNCQYIHVMSRQ
ncbi:hypothetical protein F511_00101 [Dorcoceras hygrometricum]|nr:hypothetical protein F511_00101 [Dorcoceras hygrometricum]